MSLFDRAAAFAKAEMAGNDGSHDFHHVERVRNMALRLAEEEGGDVDVELIHLAALLHDVGDYKYSGSETAAEERILDFFRTVCPEFDPARAVKVVAIVKGVGFKTELGGNIEMTPELAIVQDADRLDAVGAVGIARTFCFGGKKGTAIHDPYFKHRENLTSEEYAATKNDSTTVAHFYEKLLKLKDLMKTTSGRKVAEARHAFMEQYLEQLFAEYAGER